MQAKAIISLIALLIVLNPFKGNDRLTPKQSLYLIRTQIAGVAKDAKLSHEEKLIGEKAYKDLRGKVVKAASSYNDLLRRWNAYGKYSAAESQQLILLIASIARELNEERAKTKAAKGGGGA